MRIDPSSDCITYGNIENVAFRVELQNEELLTLEQAGDIVYQKNVLFGSGS